MSSLLTWTFEKTVWYLQEQQPEISTFLTPSTKPEAKRNMKLNTSDHAMQASIAHSYTFLVVFLHFPRLLLWVMSKSRLTSDPSVGVGDLQMAFKEWLDGESCMDVARLLKPPYQMKWKSAPIAEWIGDNSVSNLCKKLFALPRSSLQAISHGFLSVHPLVTSVLLRRRKCN